MRGCVREECTSEGRESELLVNYLGSIFTKSNMFVIESDRCDIRD